MSNLIKRAVSIAACESASIRITAHDKIRRCKAESVRGYLAQRSKLLGIAVMAVLLSYGMPRATPAATFTWTVAGDGNWTDTLKWTPNGTPGAVDTLLFNTSGSNGNETIYLNGNELATLLAFGNTGTTTLLGGIAGTPAANTLTVSGGITLNSGAGAVTIGDTAASPTASVAISLNGNQSFTNNSSSLLTIANGISSATSARTLTITGAGNTTLAGNLINGTGTTSLTKSGTGTLTLSGTASSIGTSTTAAPVAFTGGVTNVTGSLTATGMIGIVNAAIYQSGAGSKLSTTTTGTAARAFQIGSNASAAGATGGYGYYNLTGGTVSSSGQFEVGGNSDTSAGTVVGIMDMSGGTVTNSNLSQIGRGAGALGLLNVTGGTFTASNTLQLTGNGAAGVSVFNVGGGGGAAVVNVNGTGGANAFFDMANQAGTTTTNNIANLLTNGTLTAAKVDGGQANPNTFLNFNGGTLKALATTTTATTFLTGTNVDSVTVYSNGGTIDNNGVNITVSKTLAAASGNGVSSVPIATGGSGYIGAPYVTFTGGGGTGASGYAVLTGGAVSSIVITSPGTGYTSAPTVTLSAVPGATAATLGTISTAANTAGGMTFTGSGITTLSGTHTYTGTTTVANGTLLVTGTLAGNATVSGGTLLVNGSVAGGATVASGGSLGGGVGGSAGTVSGSVTSAGTIVPGGTGAVGTLAFGNNLTFSGGSINLDLNFTSNSTGGSTNDLFTVAGNLTANGVVLVSPTFIGGTPAVNTAYTIATYTGALTNGANFAAGSRAASISNTGASNGSLILTYTGASSGNLRWNSSSSGAWDVLTSANWFNTGTSAQDFFYQGDNVTFDDTAGVQTNIAINTSVLPTSVTVNSNTNSFTFGGTGGIGGGTLTKSGNSTLTITSSNAYSGATTINGGTLSVVTLAAGGTNSGIGASTNAAVNLVINGGTLQYTGAGNSTDRNFTIGDNNATIDASGAGALTITGTASFATPDVPRTLTLTGSSTAINVIGSTLAVLADNGAGALSLVKNGSGIWRTDVANIYSGGTTLNAGQLHVGNNNALGSGTLTINGGMIVARGSSRTLGNSVVVGGDFGLGDGINNNTIGLSGTVDLGGAARTITVGNSTQATDASLSNVISNGGLTKAGAGTLALTANNTYAGATTITGGPLVLSGGGTVNGTSGVTINGSDARLRQTSTAPGSVPITLTQGTLDGNGTVGAVTVNGVGGVVSNGAGDTSTLTLSSLTFTAGGSFSLNKVNDTTTTALNVTLALDATGSTLNVTTAPTWTNGTTYNMIGYGSLSGSNPSVGSLAGLGARQSATIGNTGPTSGFITLAIAGDVPYWTGAASNAWTTNAVGSPFNWKLVTAGTDTEFLTDDQVLFNDNATGTTSVEITSANVGVVSVEFNNSTKNYTISSAGGFGIANGSSGSATLTKNGSGTVTINTVNTYTGATRINGGTLSVAVIANGGVASSIGASTNAAANLVINGGTLQYTGAGNSTDRNFTIGDNNATIDASGGIGALISSGTAAFATPDAPRTLTLTGSSALINQLTGVFGNNGSGNLSIVKNGSGTWRLDGTNTYSGGTTLNAGQLHVGNNSALGNGTLTINGGSIVARGSSRTLANSVVVGGDFGLADAINNNAIELSGQVDLGGLMRTITVSDNTQATDAILSGFIFNGGLTKAGAGLMQISNSNTYSGGTTIAGGSLLASNGSALGSGAVSVSAVSGAQLQLAAGIDIGNALTINGGGVASQGIVWIPTANANATYSGAITINGSVAAGGHFASNGGLLTISGPVTSSVPVSVRAGNVLFSNTSSSYTALSVSAGTARIGVTNAIPTAATIDLGSVAAATFDLAGFNQTLAGLTKNTNAATVTNSGGSDSTLTTTGTSTFGGVIQDGGSNKTAMKVSGGALTLTGNNTYTGGTTVTAGTLIVGHVNGLGSGTTGPGLTINNTAITQLQAGLSAPVQLPSLTITGGMALTANLDDAGLVATNGWLAGDSSGIVDNTDFVQQVVAGGGGAAAEVSAAVQPVPEPSALVLAACGLAAAGILVNRRGLKRNNRLALATVSR